MLDKELSSVTVIILTLNEEKHLARALDSVISFATDVIVVDSYSTDQTIEIARRYGARIEQHPFVNQAKQFQWALDNVSMHTEWVMRLDADEVVEIDLAKEISTKLVKLEVDVVGINLKRKHIFLGRWIRHGGRYPLLLLRIWRTGKGRIEDRWMDEHILLSEGRQVTFEGGFADCNLNDLTFFIEKHNKYATREAVDILNQRRKFSRRDDGLGAASTSRQAAIKRWVKEGFYNKLPFEIASLGYFLYRYFIQLGFLDGREGFAYHFLQGYWYRYLVGAKVRELEAELGSAEGKEAVERLKELTGLAIEADG